MRGFARNPRRLQISWFVVAGAAALTCIASIPASWGSLVTPCRASSTCKQGLQLNATAVSVLRAHGFSVTSYALFMVAVLGVVWLVWYGIAALLAWRKPEDPGVLVCAFFLAVFPVALSGILLWPSFPVVVPLTGVPLFALVLFCLLFPDGHFRPRWTRWLVPVAAGSSLLVSLPLNSLPGAAPVPYFLLLLTGVGVQVYRFRSTSSWKERQQAKWAVSGLVVSVIGLVLMLLSFGLTGDVTGSLYDDLGTSAVAIIPTAIPVSIGIAVLRSKLWDIDRIISRALLYAVLTATIVGIYIGGVICLQALFGLVSRNSSAPAIVVSTLIIAALFGPLRRRIQTGIDRRFYRAKYDAAQTLATFSDCLRDEVDLGRLSQGLAGAVQETLRPEHVSLWLRDS